MEEKIFKALMIAALAVVLGSLAGIIVVVLVRGLPALNLSLLVQTPKGGYYLGKEGGIANAIVGSFCLAGGGLVIAIILGIPIAFAIQKEYAGRWVAGVTRLCLDILWGTPSIVYGAFGFAVMMYLGIRASMLGGIVTLGLLMTPIMTRSVEEVIRMVPGELKEISLGIGATRLETMLSVVFRQALPGILTGVMLAFGRGIGDAASILFTAGYTDYIPRSIMDPVASLPLAIFFQAGTPIPEVRQRAYASALVLLIIVLLAGLASRILSRRFSRYTLK